VILVALAVYAVLGLITDALRLPERRALAWRRGILGRQLPVAAGPPRGCAG
jgi:hypothetical protein